MLLSWTFYWTRRHFHNKTIKRKCRKGLLSGECIISTPLTTFLNKSKRHVLDANAAPCTDNLEISKLAQTYANGWLECNKQKVCPVMWVSPPLRTCFPWEDVGQRNRGNIPASGKLLAETMNHHFLVCCSSSTIITLLLHHFPPVFKSGQYCQSNVTAQAYNSVFWILLLK